MPSACTSKHIEESGEQRGIPEDQAKEISARTVNEGRTPNRRTQGTGDPNVPLEERTVAWTSCGTWRASSACPAARR